MMNHKKKRYKFKLDIQEKIPVSTLKLVPGQKIKDSNLKYSWIKINKLTKFIIREKDELLGFVSKYYKKQGDYFYRRDIKKEIVIRSGDKCSIHLKYNSVQISMLGIALKNGAIGSKIKVVNKTTNKTLDAFVINSKNVEVKL